VAEAGPVEQTNVLLIGSLMSWADANTLVCGTGMLAPDQLPKVAPREFLSVRGPLSAYFLRKVGFEVPERFGDLGILAGDFVEGAGNPEHRIGVILHHSEKWMEKKICRRNFGLRQDVFLIDITADPINVLMQIRRCEMIFSSSLHGIIFAHRLGRPAAWLEVSDRIAGKGFKFFDYFMSLGVTPDRVPLLHDHSVINLTNFESLPTLPDISGLKAQAREALDLLRDRLSLC